jgi:hypothetical protein
MWLHVALGVSFNIALRQREDIPEDIPMERYFRIEESVQMHVSADPYAGGNSAALPEGANIFSRKVARSGHISYEGRPYFVSKTLAGRYVRLIVLADRLIVDTSIPLHKEYSLL